MEEEIANRIESVRRKAGLLRLCILQKRSGVPEQSLISFRKHNSIPSADRFLAIEQAVEELFSPEFGEES